MVKNKETRLTKEEHICISSITSSLFGLFIIIALMSSLMINSWLFIGVLFMIFFYSLISFFTNYLKFKNLLKKRKKNERKN